MICPPGAAPPGLSQPSGDSASFLNQVFLSTRRGAWIFNRVGDQGYPIDIIFTTRMKQFLKAVLSQSMVSNFTEKQLNARFDHSHYGLKPKHRCQQKLPLPRRGPPWLPLCPAPLGHFRAPCAQVRAEAPALETQIIVVVGPVNA